VIDVGDNCDVANLTCFHASYYLVEKMPLKANDKHREASWKAQTARDEIFPFEIANLK